MEERTIKNLLKDDSKAYIYFESKEIMDLFIKNADNEGLYYGDGVSLYEREPLDVMVLNNNFTISYTGFAGYMAFNHPEYASFKFVRIDYAKYVAGEEDYFYSEKSNNLWTDRALNQNDVTS